MLAQVCSDNTGFVSLQVMCSFLQVYQEKVYDLLNPRFIVDLPVREHPKKGMHAFLNKNHPLHRLGPFTVMGFQKSSISIWLKT